MPENKTPKPPRRIRRYPAAAIPFIKGMMTCTLIAVMLGSCSKDEPIEMPSINQEQHPEVLNPIEFDTSTCSGRAHVTDSQNLKEGFGIYAFTADQAFNPSEFEANFMYNQKVYNLSGKWEYSPLKYWNTTSKMTSFLAYAPYQPTSSTMLTYLEPTSSPSSHPSLRYNLPRDISSEIDLVYASVIDIDGKGAPTVNLNFEHALSRVAFSAQSELIDEQLSAGKSIQIKKITVESIGDNPIYTSGNLALDTGEWSELTKENTTFLLRESNFNFTTLTQRARLITNAESYLMLIPQRSAYKVYPTRTLTATEGYLQNIAQEGNRSFSHDQMVGQSKTTSLNNYLSSINEELAQDEQISSKSSRICRNSDLTSSSKYAIQSIKTSTRACGQSQYNTQSTTHATPVDWKILVESVIVDEDGTEHQNDVYAVCSDVIFTQGYGYEICLAVGVNSLKVTINEGDWNQIDQNEWFAPDAFQEEFHIKGTIPNMGKDDAVYTVKSLYDATLNVELLKQEKTLYPGEFILDDEYIDIGGLVKKNRCYLIIENQQGQQWSLPIRFKYGYMQMTINIYSNASPEDKTYIIPVGKGQQPSTLMIQWGDGTFSKEIRTLTDENNFHVYAAKGNYAVRVLSSQNNYDEPQITYVCGGIEDENRGEVPVDAAYYTTQEESYLHDMPVKLLTMDTPLMHYSREVNSTFTSCTKLKNVHQNLFRYNPQLTDCSFCFLRCVSLQYAPELWNMPQFTRHVSTFSKCYPSNISSIPASWF